jgi:hypothetical protein
MPSSVLRRVILPREKTRSENDRICDGRAWGDVRAVNALAPAHIA